MGTISYSVGQKCYSEYTKQVDFRRCAKHCNWCILIFVPIGRASKINSDLQARGLLKHFRSKTKVLGSGNNIGFIFLPININHDTNIRNRRNLLNYLGNEKIKIIWKEDQRGYEIDQSGNIKRKWSLKSDMLALPELNLFS
jgi:hypothetical protein